MKVALTALAVVAAAAMFNADTMAQTVPSSNAAPTGQCGDADDFPQA
jgi:hypothetical protein